MESDWLRLYGSADHDWKQIDVEDGVRLHRSIGLVESTFDSDGRYWEGRADINLLLELEAKGVSNRAKLHERIRLAWSALRVKHCLLQAKALPRRAILDDEASKSEEINFVIDVPRCPQQAMSAAHECVFLDQHYDTVDPADFWCHSQNTGRVLNPAQALARIFVFPIEQKNLETAVLRFQLVVAHHILDGIAMYVCMRDFVHFLNSPLDTLREQILKIHTPETIRAALPLPQEVYYPTITGSRARRRWFWLLMRILRHVRKPLQAGFPNPLYRRAPSLPTPLSPIYAAVLDYNRTPPLNTVRCNVHVSRRGTQRLHRLCREANVSIGAGCFALSALVMMEMDELVRPDIVVRDRKPFISGFPINPRAFFDKKVEPDSCMLAFSDGIALPFLARDLPFDGRLRLLARQAQRQLAAYQKRKPAAIPMTEFMGSRGAGRVLANQYIGSIERADAQLPEHLRSGHNPQGAYPARPNMTSQTCGVSSVGKQKSVVASGMYDLSSPSELTDGFVADYRSLTAGVRARPGEFLVGIGGSDEGLWANVSIDASAADLSLVSVWKEKMERILEDGPGGGSQPAKL